ncbi:MAG: phosphatase family protein [Flavisolibacter sp.]|jgi:membrane-associated phospholipid phosphatase|nr:phosphatase family protein [Flavisolibacter sp.]
MVHLLSKKAKKIWGAVTLLSVEMLAVLLLFITALLSFAYLIRKVIVLHQTGLDERVFAFLKNYSSNRADDLMLFFTFLGTHNFLIPANLVLIAYFLFIKKNKWYSIKIPAIALSSLGLMVGLKHLFGRPRPDLPLIFKADGLSFPSGHAMFSVTFYGLLIYFIYTTVLNKVLKWTLIFFLLLLVIVIGFTRVYLRVHYASDVIAGFSVGFMWLVFALTILNRMERYSRKKINPTPQ